jgi:hypothetical protein
LHVSSRAGVLVVELATELLYAVQVPFLALGAQNADRDASVCLLVVFELLAAAGSVGGF